MLKDVDLYVRGSNTLVASWEEYARLARCAAVHRLPGVAAAVFTSGPERAVYNNALLSRGLAAGDRADALAAMESVYASASVRRFAAWVHESDEAMRREIERRGYVLDSSTRAMGMALADARTPEPEIELGPASVDDRDLLVGSAGEQFGADARLRDPALAARLEAIVESLADWTAQRAA